MRRWARLYEDEEEERRKWVPLTSIQHAEAKRVAAEAALHLCDEFAIKPTTTKDGAFCALAAVMWGDETADLQKHCIEVLAPGYRTFLARRSAESRPVMALTRARNAAFESEAPRTAPSNTSFRTRVHIRMQAARAWRKASRRIPKATCTVRISWEMSGSL